MAKIYEYFKSLKKYTDILNSPAVGHDKIVKICKFDNIKQILTSFRNDYTEFKDYNDFFTFVILTNYSSIDELLKEIPLCKYCKIGRRIPHKYSKTNGIEYRDYCKSEECIKSSRKEKYVSTCLKKYGTEYAIQSDSVKNKVKQTSLDRYGVTNIAKLNRTTKKKEDTCMKRYGVTNPGKLDYIIKNNVDHFQNLTIKEKDAILEKRIQTNIERYNVTNAMKSDIFKNKFKETCNRIYGSDHYSKTNEYKINHLNNQFKKRYKTLSEYDSDIKPLFTLDEFKKLCNNNLNNQLKIQFHWHCTKCGNDFYAPVNENFLMDYKVSRVRCPICYPCLSCSVYEKQITDYIKSIYNGMVDVHNRKIIYPKELDIYLPEKHLAIEFDGLYWHSEEVAHKNVLGKDVRYHLDKTNDCNDSNIKLIHIFEDEWVHHPDIVKSRIKNLLGLCTNRIFARKCIVKEVDSKTSIEFQDANHLQGHIIAKINIGLYYNGELVSLMTFGKSRFDSHHEWELLRFCNKLDTSVVGAASKLLSCFERTYKPKSIISYADRRWSTGNVYEKLGFTLDHISEPNYWYWKDDNTSILYSRIKFQKYKLPQLLENFDPNLTEVENMYANGYNRIFDCGNLVFVKKY